MTTRKKSYATPTANAITVKAEGILCSSFSVYWYYEGSSLSSEDNWTRNGYGDAEVI